MYKKKSTLLIATLLLISIFFTGCGVNTLGFMTYLEEMQKVSTTKATQTTSTLSISNLAIPADIVSANQKPLVDSIKGFLDQHSIIATQKVHPKKDIVSISFDTVNKKTNKKEHILTLNYKDQAFALSAGPKLTELLRNAPADVQVAVAAFDQKLIPVSVLKQLFVGQDLVLDSLANRKNLLDINDKSMAYLKEFVKIYTTADTDIITKEGNSYVFEMHTPEFVKFIDAFVTQTIQNKDAILAATIKFYESLTPEQYNALYGQVLPGGQAEIVAMLKEAMEEPLPENTVDSWKAVYTTEISPVLLSAMDGSSVRMRTWKENNNYYTNTYSVLKISNPDNLAEKYTATVLAKEEIQVISDDFDITMPTEVIPQEFIDALFQGYTEEIEISLED